jgi:hypothetical protein
MAFTFMVEDGTGVANATSYVSVEDADDILSMNIHASGSWEALTLDKKQKLLSWASRYLDERTRWFGRRAETESSLRWPRTGITDRDGNPISDTIVPRQLKIAAAEMARYLIDQDRTVERDQDALTRLKADVIELEFEEGYRLPQVPSHMKHLIKGLGVISTGTGVRFARIMK